MIHIKTHIKTLKFTVLVLLLSVALVSCGTKKKSNDKEQATPTKPLSNRSPSSADLIYKNNFYEALRLRTVGDQDEAQKILEWCLTQKPEDDAVHYLLATDFYERRRITKAKEHIEKASKIDPENIWYVDLLAKIQVETDDFAGAEKSFKRLVAHDRYNREWLYYYSETLIFNQNYAEAIEIMSRLIDEVGPVPELVHQRNELYVELKRDEEMLIVLHGLIQEYPDVPDFTSMLLGYYHSKKQLDVAESELLKIIKNNKNHAAARITLADLYNALNRTDEALDQLKFAFETNTLDLDNSIQVLLAVLDRKEAMDEKALELAQILSEKHPNHFIPHALIGEIHKAKGNTKESLAAFKRSLELNNDNFELWQEVVSTQFALKNYKATLETAEEALELFPSQPELYYYAGMSALRSKQFDEALAFFETGKDFIMRDPSFKAQFELSTAEVYLAQNNIPSARKHLAASEKLAPSSKLMMNNRAYVMAKYKLDLDKALETIQQALIGNEKDALFLDTYAWVRFARKEYEQALETIKLAHAISPNNGEINEHYGDILFKFGRIDEAISFWIKAKELGDESDTLLQKIQQKKLIE